MGYEDVQMRNLEHRANRAGWLRAAVLGSNDGLVSTASLMIGIAAATVDVSHLAKGVYSAIVVLANGNTVAKAFIINEK